MNLVLIQQRAFRFYFRGLIQSMSKSCNDFQLQPVENKNRSTDLEHQNALHIAIEFERCVSCKFFTIELFHDVFNEATTKQTTNEKASPFQCIFLLSRVCVFLAVGFDLLNIQFASS